MQTNNPYAPPESDLTPDVQSNSQKRTIEEALNADYDFNIGAVISRAWQAVSGMKLNYFLGSLIIGIISVVLGVISGIATNLQPILGLILEIVFQLFIMSLATGYIVISLKRLRGETVSFGDDFFSFTNILMILILAIFLKGLLTFVGFLLLVIPGIYLGTAYCFTLWILADHPGTGVWEAMEASRKLVTRNWFKIFVVLLILGFILTISAIPLGIGLIWTIPLYFLTLGVIYQRIFGEI